MQKCPSCGKMKYTPLYTFSMGLGHAVSVFGCLSCLYTYEEHLVIGSKTVTEDQTPMYSDNEGKEPLKQEPKG